jgi:hypothetical protein
VRNAKNVKTGSVRRGVGVEARGEERGGGEEVVERFGLS